MRVEIALVTGGGLQKNELFAGERPRGVYGQIGPVYPPNGGQKDDPEAFYGGHTPTGAIPTENEPRPATSSRLLYPQSTLRSVKALRDKEDYPLRLLKSRCDPGVQHNEVSWLERSGKFHRFKCFSPLVFSALDDSVLRLGTPTFPRSCGRQG